MQARRFLAFSTASKKLYVRTPGGAWAEFSVQPTMGITAGAMCCGLPDGSIIVLDDAAWKMRHWDPATAVWIDRGHPGTISQWSVSVAAGSADAVVASASGHVATYTAATTTWALLASFGGTLVDIAEFGTLDDIWTAHYGAGGEVRNYDGSWHTHRAAIEAAIGFALWCFQKISRLADGTIYVTALGLDANNVTHLIKRTPAGVWSLLGSYSGGGQRGLWAANSTHVWIQGPNWGGGDDHLWLWNGTAISHVMQLASGSGPTPIKSVHGIDANRVLCCAVGTIVRETTDGAAWSVTADYAGADVAQFGTLWLEEVAPTIENESPGAGARWTEPGGWTEFDALDAGGSGIDVAETVVTIGGAIAWIADALGSGFEGARTATDDGYHYKLRRATWPRPSAPTVVSVAIADLAANVATKTWSFTEWGADARSQEYIRVMDGLLPPGAFGGEA